MPGLKLGLIGAIRLPDTAYCSGVSPAHFARSVGVENVCSHCAKPGEFHAARAHVFLVSVVDKLMFGGFFSVAFLKICQKGVGFC